MDDGEAEDGHAEWYMPRSGGEGGKARIAEASLHEHGDDESDSDERPARSHIGRKGQHDQRQPECERAVPDPSVEVDRPPSEQRLPGDDGLNQHEHDERDRQTPVDGARTGRLPRRGGIRTDRSCDALYHVPMLSRPTGGGQFQSTPLAFRSKASSELARQSNWIPDRTRACLGARLEPLGPECHRPSLGQSTAMAGHAGFNATTYVTPVVL